MKTALQGKIKIKPPVFQSKAVTEYLKLRLRLIKVCKVESESYELRLIYLNKSRRLMRYVRCNNIDNSSPIILLYTTRLEFTNFSNLRIMSL